MTKLAGTVVPCALVVLVTVGCGLLTPTQEAVTPSLSPTLTPLPVPTATEVSLVEITVYFTDEESYAAGVPPFESSVTRLVAPTASLPELVLTEFFKGPTAEESAAGLAAVMSGFTGYSSLLVQDGIAHVYLEGPCASLGATYTIAQPIFANLRQFSEIQWIKIYDAGGDTEEPAGPSNSIPFCLEP